MGVISRAPTRIDLAGGTLDIWPLYLLHPGAMTINAGITIHAEAEAVARERGFAIVSEDRGLTAAAETAEGLAAAEPRLRLPAMLVEKLSSGHPVTLTLRANAPAHAGLGGSSALAVAAAGALDRFAGGSRDRMELGEMAMDVETAVIAVPTGMQDHLGALYGGLQALHWDCGGLLRERLDPSGLAERLVLCYTGAPRFSGANNWEITKRRIDGDADVTRRLDGIRDATRALLEALRRHDYPAAATAMNAEWQERRALSPGTTTPEIDLLDRAARGAGASAFKVCGAGGGGCVVAMAEPDRREAVLAAMRDGGGQVLPFAIDEAGLQVDGMETSGTSTP